MTTQTEKLLTAEEFAEIAARGDVGRCELVEGRLLPLSGAKPRHGRIAGRVFRYIDRHVEKQRLGVVYAAETGYVVARSPDTIKCPDVSFVRAERVASHDEDEYFESPDLAVEVLSPSNRASDVEAKVATWLHAGARSVWVVRPGSRSISIFHDDGSVAEIGPDDVLSDESVLPGFALQPTRKLFA
jgi:Uma2 family endonuclease